MAQRLKEVDVVVIGVGMVGTMVSKELAAAGYKVVGLERGQTRATVPEFQSPGIHDELRFDDARQYA
jgi:gluconate 2-dehydrogenase alpha chain